MSVNKLFNWKSRRGENEEIIFSDCEFLSKLDSFHKGDRVEEICLNLSDLSLKCSLGSGKKVTLYPFWKKEDQESTLNEPIKKFINMADYQ